MDILDLCDFKMKIAEGEIPSNELIIKFINAKDEHNENNIFIAFTLRNKFNIEIKKDYITQYNFYLNLFQRINSFLSDETIYTLDDLKIYAYLAINIDEIFKEADLLSHYEQFLLLKPSSNNEIYVKERLKYNLLSLYLDNYSLNKEKIKNLYTELVNNKESYNILKETIEKEILGAAIDNE